MYLQLHVLPVVMYLHKAAPFVSKPCLCFNVVVPGDPRLSNSIQIQFDLIQLKKSTFRLKTLSVFQRRCARWTSDCLIQQSPHLCTNLTIHRLLFQFLYEGIITLNLQLSLDALVHVSQKIHTVEQGRPGTLEHSVKL